MAIGLLSYSHRDEQLRDELAAHLAVLRREDLIEIWCDRQIAAGQPVDATIEAQLQGADLILLLVSPDFINSDYCYEMEMRRAMERHARGEAVVIPVILRPCEWRPTPFGHLLATSKDGKPVTTLVQPRRGLPRCHAGCVLWNPDARGSEPRVRELHTAAGVLKLTLHIFEARNVNEFDGAFAAMARAHLGGLIVVPDPLTLRHRDQVVRLAAQTRFPATYGFPEFARAGGFLAYGPSVPDLHRGRIRQL